MGDYRSSHILGVRVDDITFEETISAIREFIEERSPHQIVTVNPEFVMTAQANDEFRHVINHADLSLPDGIGIWWASRWLGAPIRQRVPGVDLVQSLAGLSHETECRIFLLGAMPGVAERAAAEMLRSHPNAKFVGTFSGAPDLDAAPDIIAEIRAATPDILLVAFGAPAQDLWIARHIDQLDVPVCIGVGGSFDYIAGERPLAPNLLRRIGLEWFFRLLTQPWRWRRMLALPRFAWRVLWSNCHDRHS
jgi:N-acetylglucosaminyldiphosphoundecaprenol N-acetyl-beta-D-mannosaminyltransferase